MDYDMDDAGSRLADTVRGNPLPLALVGLGLGWLLVNGLRNSGASSGSESGAPEGLGYARASRYGAEESYGSMEGASGIDERARSYARSVGEAGRQWRDRAVEVGSRVGHQAQDWARSAGERARSAGSTARHRAGRLANRSLHTVEEHPVMVGAVALLVGAAIGASLPRSRREDEWLGDARDEVFRQARDSGVVDKVRSVGERTVEAVKEGGEEVFERVKDAAKDATGDAFQHVRDTARDEAERQDLPGTQGYRH